MSSYSAPIDVYRKAMPLIGAEPPSSLDDGTDEAITANAVYEGIVEDVLSRHGWSFATKRATLVYQGESGDKPAYIYSLPSEILSIRHVLYDLYAFKDYELRSNKLYCDITENTDLDIIYNWRAPESSWPSDFAWAVVNKLAAALAQGLLDRARQGEALDMKAEKLLHRASVRDRRSSGNLPFQSDPPLVKKWRGTSRRGNTVVAS